MSQWNKPVKWEGKIGDDVLRVRIQIVPDDPDFDPRSAVAFKAVTLVKRLFFVENVDESWPNGAVYRWANTGADGVRREVTAVAAYVCQDCNTELIAPTVEGLDHGCMRPLNLATLERISN